jgi:hypothetical protein
VAGGDPRYCLIAGEVAGVATFFQKLLRNEKSKHLSKKGGNDGTISMNSSKAFTKSPLST